MDRDKVNEYCSFLLFFIKRFRFGNKKLRLRVSQVNWNASKRSQAPIKKFERPNRKIPNSKIILTSVKNWCPQLT